MRLPLELPPRAGAVVLLAGVVQFHSLLTSLNLDGSILPISKLKGTEPVESLDLAGKGLGNKSAIAIAACLRHNLSIAKCNVRENQFDAAAARRLAKVGTARRILLADGCKDGETEADAILAASDMALSNVGTCVEACSAAYSGRVLRAAGYSQEEILAAVLRVGTI